MDSNTTLDQLAVNPADVRGIPGQARVPCAMLAAILNLPAAQIWAVLWRKANPHPAALAEIDVLRGALRAWEAWCEGDGNPEPDELHAQTRALLQPAPAPCGECGDMYCSAHQPAPAACPGCLGLRYIYEGPHDGKMVNLGSCQQCNPDGALPEPPAPAAPDGPDMLPPGEYDAMLADLDAHPLADSDALAKLREAGAKLEIACVQYKAGANWRTVENALKLLREALEATDGR